MGQWDMLLSSGAPGAFYHTKQCLLSRKELGDHFVIEVDGSVGTLVCDSFIMEIPHARVLSEVPTPLATLKEPTSRKALFLDAVLTKSLGFLSHASSGQWIQDRIPGLTLRSGLY